MYIIYILFWWSILCLWLVIEGLFVNSKLEPSQLLELEMLSSLLVLVGPRKGFERDSLSYKSFHVVELKINLCRLILFFMCIYCTCYPGGNMSVGLNKVFAQSTVAICWLQKKIGNFIRMIKKLGQAYTWLSARVSCSYFLIHL